MNNHHSSKDITGITPSIAISCNMAIMATKRGSNVMPGDYRNISHRRLCNEHRLSLQYHATVVTIQHDRRVTKNDAAVITNDSRNNAIGLRCNTHRLSL